MARSILELSREIQGLSRSEKEGLLGALVADLSFASDPEVDAAWLRESQRRGAEIDEGRIKCVPAADVFKRLDASLKK